MMYTDGNNVGCVAPCEEPSVKSYVMSVAKRNEEAIVLLEEIINQLTGRKGSDTNAPTVDCFMDAMALSVDKAQYMVTLIYDIKGLLGV